MLLRSLSRWGILAVGTRHSPALSAVFDAFTTALAATASGADDELRWYFERRRLVDRGDLAQVSVFDLRRFRTLRQRFDSPAHERALHGLADEGKYRSRRHPGRPRATRPAS